jgi:hypothetical protein
VGDRGGRVIIFKRYEEDKVLDYEYLTEFLAFETSYDTLTSQPIPEKINMIEWLNRYRCIKP